MSAIKPSVENTPLDEDRAYLKCRAENPMLTDSERQAAARGLAEFDHYLTLFEWLRTVAKQLNLEQFCMGLPDQTLAHFLAFGQGAVRSWVGRLLARYPEQMGVREDCDFEASVAFWSSLFTVAMGDELGRRQSRKETTEGRQVRELVVEEEERDERLAELGKLAAAFLSVPQSTGASFSHQGKEEARQIAVCEIWAAVSEYTNYDPPAANPNFLFAAMQGGLNKVPLKAREKIRNLIATECRHHETTVPGDAPARRGEEHSSQTLIDMQFSKDLPGSKDSKILFEQVLSIPELDEEEKRLLTDFYARGLTQSEVASEHDKSQSQVSKQLQVAKEKIRERFGHLNNF